MQSTRSEILAYLANHPRSSAGDISRYLGMTIANIRYHLKLLEQDGQVQVSGRRSPGGAGRPISLYNLTSRALGDNLTALLEAILGRIVGSENLTQEIQKIANGFAALGPPPASNLVARYNQAVEFLNKHHYHASWVARPEGPQVSLRHCPYLNLALTHPILCRLDEELISILFNTELNLSQKRSFGKDPFSPCIFNPPEDQGEKG